MLKLLALDTTPQLPFLLNRNFRLYPSRYARNKTNNNNNNLQKILNIL